MDLDFLPSLLNLYFLILSFLFLSKISNDNTPLLLYTVISRIQNQTISQPSIPSSYALFAFLFFFFPFPAISSSSLPKLVNLCMDILRYGLNILIKFYKFRILASHNNLRIRHDSEFENVNFYI